MKRVGLFGMMSREGVTEIMKIHTARLEGSYDVAVFDFDSELPADVSLDLAVVFGGDGTILKAARFLAPRGIPAIGVNLGKFGFLAGCESSDCPDLIGSVLAGKAEPIARTMLCAEIDRAGKSSEQMTALNEVVVTSSAPANVVGVKLSISGAAVSSFLGDGLIVSTATGSTGYNLSAGGPVVSPSEDVMIVTGLSPHTLSVRPMVVSGSEIIDVEVSARHCDVAVIGDGQVGVTMSHGDRVKVSRAPYCFDLYEVPGWNFFDVVKAKLRWGEEINYAKDPY